MTMCTFNLNRMQVINHPLTHHSLINNHPNQYYTISLEDKKIHRIKQTLKEVLNPFKVKVIEFSDDIFEVNCLN